MLLAMALTVVTACQANETEVTETMGEKRMDEKLKQAQTEAPHAMPPFDEIPIDKPEYNTIQQMLSDMVRILQPHSEEQSIFPSSLELENHVATSTYLYTVHILTFGTIQSEEMKNDILRLQKYANAVKENKDIEAHEKLFQTFQAYLTTLNEKYKKEEE